MKNLEKKCKNLKNQFDIEEPNLGHFNRFEDKLKGSTSKKKFKFNYKYLAIAAAMLLLISIGFKTFQSNNGIELASVSPKMEETQDYFASVIQVELEKINAIKNPENIEIINDALKQLNLIENNYQKLKIDLQDNDNSKHIIFAMINNFQQRITVLQNLLTNLDNFKQLKNIQNENKTI
jgi:hypothetical protein